MTFYCILFVFTLHITFVINCIVEGEWKLAVRTSDMDNAGTSARVFVTFYGAKSHSDKIRLTNEDSNPFQRGKESTFMVMLYLNPHCTVLRCFYVFEFVLIKATTEICRCPTICIVCWLYCWATYLEIGLVEWARWSNGCLLWTW